MRTAEGPESSVSPVPGGVDVEADEDCGSVAPRLRARFGLRRENIPESLRRCAVAQIHDSMVNPRIEVLLSKVDSRFTLVSLGAQRARQINAYFNQLGEGQGSNVPPQVTSLARKPLSIAFEEISADKIIPVRVDPVELLIEDVVEGSEETIELAEAIDEAPDGD